MQKYVRFSKPPELERSRGSYVLDGTIQRDSSARIIRDGIVVHEGKLASIQRGKDAVKEVRKWV